MPAKEQVRRVLASMPGRTLGDYVDSIRDVFVPKRAAATTRVRNYDVTDALLPQLDTEKETSMVSEIGSVKKRFADGDVVISRLRAYLREIAVVQKCDDVPVVGSSEFIVLRLRDRYCNITAETLMVFLRSVPVQTILKWCQDGSQHPRFGESDLLSIFVPDVVAEASEEITAITRESFSAHRQARRLFETVKRAVETAIEDGERAGITFLDETLRQANGASPSRRRVDEAG